MSTSSTRDTHAIDNDLVASGCNHDPESASQFAFQLRQQMVVTPLRESSRALGTAPRFTFTRERTSTSSSWRERRVSFTGTTRSTPRQERWLVSLGVSRMLGEIPPLLRFVW